MGIGSMIVGGLVTCAEKVQSIPTSKQGKYYGKSYLRLALGFCVIGLVISLFIYTVHEMVDGPLVRVNSFTDECSKVRGRPDDFDTCECTDENINLREFFDNNAGMELIRNISLSYLPAQYITRYSASHHSTEPFMNFFNNSDSMLEPANYSQCVVTPGFIENLNSTTKTPACNPDLEWIPDWDFSVNFCTGQYDFWKNTMGLTAVEPYTGKFAYLDTCVYDFELHSDFYAGEARIFNFLKTVEQEWSVKGNDVIPNEVFLAFFRGQGQKYLSKRLHRTILEAVSRTTRAPIMVPPEDYLEDKFESIDICDVCKSFTCTTLEEITNVDIAMYAVAYAGGFLSIFILVAQLFYDFVSGVAYKIYNIEIDYAIDGIHKKSAEAGWSPFGGAGQKKSASSGVSA